jgi:hypothetical protein
MDDRISMKIKLISLLYPTSRKRKRKRGKDQEERLKLCGLPENNRLKTRLVVKAVMTVCKIARSAMRRNLAQL